jgi:hypothetical protein
MDGKLWCFIKVEDVPKDMIKMVNVNLCSYSSPPPNQQKKKKKDFVKLNQIS